MLNSNYLKRISFWGRIIGIIAAIYGLTAITIAFYTYYSFIISGLVSLWLGKLIFNIGGEAKKVLQTEDTSIHIKDAKGVFNKYTYFLFILSLLIAITVLSHFAIYIYIDS